MSQTPTEAHQRLPPPYHHHHHHHHRYGRHGLDGSFSVGGHRDNVDYRIPAIEKYAFCLCLHVRPMTIFIAAYKLIEALLNVSKLVNTELSFDEQTSSDLSKADGVHRSTAVAFEILTRIIMASASGVAIYAAVSGRAALLMPLYSVLLIEFFFALPSFYGRDMDPAYASDGVIGVKNNSATNNDQYNRYSVFISTLLMVTKIYFLCVIWKCYRYLRLIQLVGEMCAQMPSPIVRVLGLEDGVQDISQNQGGAPPPYDSIASSLKPPNYEDAIKSSNIYTIDVQPHNSQLPNYTSTLSPPPPPPPGTQQQP